MLWSRWREKCTWAEGTGRVLWQESGAENNEKGGSSCVSSWQQWSSRTNLICVPTTADCARFWLLCCQPRQIPGLQSPGHQSFRNDALAKNLLGQCRPSAWFARLKTILNTPPPTTSCDKKNKPSQILKIRNAYEFVKQL